MRKGGKKERKRGGKKPEERVKLERSRREGQEERSRRRV